MFDSREDVLRWARSVAYENGFVAVIVRSDTNTGSRGRNSFVIVVDSCYLIIPGFEFYGHVFLCVPLYIILKQIRFEQVMS